MMLLLPLLMITMSTNRYRPVMAALAIMTSVSDDRRGLCGS
jgi:hypothetical protein